MSENQQDSKLIKLVLILGFFLQFIVAYILFTLIRDMAYFEELIPQYNLAISLLSSLMVATPIGFLMANFIFHHLPFVRRKIDKISDYKSTQILLLKTLGISIVFVVLIVSVILFI